MTPITEPPFPELRWLSRGMWSTFIIGGALMGCSGYGFLTETWSYVGAFLTTISVVIFLRFTSVVKKELLRRERIKNADAQLDSSTFPKGCRSTDYMGRPIR
jgi:hypothetical protein